MNQNSENVSKKSVISNVFYVAAAIVAIIGVALLINNIYLYKTSYSQAVAQGYSAATVKKALMTSQLLPGIFQPIALYEGIAFLLLGVGIVNKKISRSLTLLAKAELCSDSVEENVNQNVVNVDKAETTKKIKIEKDIEKA